MVLTARVRMPKIDEREYVVGRSLCGSATWLSRGVGVERSRRAVPRDRKVVSEEENYLMS